MNKKVKSFIYGILGVLVGFIIGLTQNGEINWQIIGSFFAILLLILLFKLVFNLYKKKIEYKK